MNIKGDYKINLPRVKTDFEFNFQGDIKLRMLVAFICELLVKSI